MKRSPLKIRGIRLGRVIDNFTLDQLAGIGAVMMTYNEAETALHDLVGACIDFRGDAHEIVSRINGTEGMVEIVLVGAKQFGIEPQQLVPSLKGEGFMFLKSYRDAVAHARIFDAASGIAKVRKSKGKRLEVLLSVPALEWLANQLLMLTDEMRALIDALHAARRLHREPKPDDKHRARLEEFLRGSLAQCKSRRTARLSQKQPPEFPAEPPVIRWGKPSDPLSFLVTTTPPSTSHRTS